MDYYTLESVNIIIIREATYLRVEIFNITKCRLIYTIQDKPSNFRKIEHDPIY